MKPIRDWSSRDELPLEPPQMTPDSIRIKMRSQTNKTDLPVDCSIKIMQWGHSSI